MVNNIGNGRIVKIKNPAAINTEEDISSSEADLLQVNLTFEQSELLQDTFQIDWKCEQGLVENIEEIVSQYRNSRKLKPVKLCILAPPQSGKSALAKKLALEYKLHIIKAENIVQDTIDNLQAIIARSQTVTENQDEEDEEEGDEEDDSVLEEARELLTEIQENVETPDARVEDELFCKIFKYHLTSKKCKNQGFLLDGFPKTFEQAKILFGGDGGEEEEEEEGPAGTHNNSLPEMVVSLIADDEWLKTRVMHLNESDIQGTHNDEVNFLRRLKTYRENNQEDLSPLTFFDQREVHPTEYVLDGQVDPTIIDTNYGMEKWKLGDEPSSTDGTFSSILTHIREIIGAPRNYGLTSSEEAEIKLIFEERKIQADKEAKERLQKDLEEEERKQKESMQKWAEQLAEVHRQEAERFQASSMELRNYLMKYVMPTLTKAVHETTKVKPDDPVDFIAEYLFKHNPQYD